LRRVTASLAHGALEARAHVIVQAQIYARFHAGELGDPASQDVIRWLHRDFYVEVPAVFREIKGRDRGFMMEPGAFRAAAYQDVEVGRHVPPSGAA
jgi:hypothetical protein